MSFRTKIKRKKWWYVVRDSKGRFVDWVNIGVSIFRDSLYKAKRIFKKPGRGHRGDYKKRKR